MVIHYKYLCDGCGASFELLLGWFTVQHNIAQWHHANILDLRVIVNGKWVIHPPLDGVGIFHLECQRQLLCCVQVAYHPFHILVVVQVRVLYHHFQKLHSCFYVRPGPSTKEEYFSHKGTIYLLFLRGKILCIILYFKQVSGCRDGMLPIHVAWLFSYDTINIFKHCGIYIYRLI